MGLARPVSAPSKRADIGRWSECRRGRGPGRDANRVRSGWEATSCSMRWSSSVIRRRSAVNNSTNPRALSWQRI
jgi:hypothetical protein